MLPATPNGTGTRPIEMYSVWYRYAFVRVWALVSTLLT